MLVGLLLVVVLGAVGLVVLGGGDRLTDYGSVDQRVRAARRVWWAAGVAASRDAAAAPSGAVGPATARQADQGSVPVGSVARSLVRTAQLTVEVDEPAAATRQVRAAVAGAAGMVVEEQSTDAGAWLALRVPADTLDRLIDYIAGLGHVTGRTARSSTPPRRSSTSTPGWRASRPAWPGCGRCSRRRARSATSWPSSRSWPAARPTSTR